MNAAQRASYPNLPGARGTETSREAARAVQPRASVLREEILAWLAQGPLTTRELTGRLAPTPYCNVQPRVAQLKAQGKIEPCPQLERSAAGWPVARWRLLTGPPHPSPLGQRHPDPHWGEKLRETMAADVVRALASEPKTSETLARELRQRESRAVTTVVSRLRRAKVLQPSGLHGLTRYGKRAVRWEIQPGPYAPEVPERLLAVVRQVLGPELTRTPTASQFATCE